MPALQVKRALRLGIYFTFLLGSVNMAVSLVRFVMIFKAAADSTISLSTISMSSRLLQIVCRLTLFPVLWSALDVNMGLVIACLPSLRPYFGSRNKTEAPSFESANRNAVRKPSIFAFESFRHNYKQYDEEGSSSLDWQQVRQLSGWEGLDGTSDNGKDKCTDASDVELVEMRHLPVAKTSEIKP